MLSALREPCVVFKENRRKGKGIVLSAGAKRGEMNLKADQQSIRNIVFIAILHLEKQTEGEGSDR